MADIDSTAVVHSTAIVEPGARIGAGTTIDAYSIVRAHVKLGSNNRIGPHVVIEGHTTIGDGNRFFQFCSVGAEPQDQKWRGEASTLEIGDNNIIREYVTLQPGTAPGGMVTRIGSNNLFMANSHVGHDSIVGDGNWFANSAALAGHVIVGNQCIMAGLSGLHQWARLGDMCFVAAGAMVSKDVPPFCTVHGDHAVLVGLNKIGLARRGFNAEDTARLSKVYKKLFRDRGSVADKVEACRAEFGDWEPAQMLVDFLSSSKRGVVQPRRRGAESDEAGAE